MIILDNLIRGIPQNVQEPEVLLGLLAWHIYPDMSIIGDTVKSVFQKDPLVAPGGIITLGMISNTDSDSNGISWSLPLSHLRYYGEPVASAASIENTASRISFEEMMFVALGGLTKTWFEKMEDAEESILFLVELCEFFKRNLIMVDWIQVVGQTAGCFLETKGEAREEAMRLLAHGRRRCAFFTTPEGPKFPAAFGLKSRATQFKLLKKSAEGRIAWLREQLPRALPRGYLAEECIIMYRLDIEDQVQSIHSRQAVQLLSSKHNHAYHPDTLKGFTDVEFATLCPLPQSGSMGGLKLTHRRWISANESGSISVATVPGFHNILTASAYRCYQLDAQGELCSLFTGRYSLTTSIFDTWELFKRPESHSFRLTFGPQEGPRKPIQTTSPTWAELVRALNPSFSAAKLSYEYSEKATKKGQLESRSSRSMTSSARDSIGCGTPMISAFNRGSIGKGNITSFQLRGQHTTFPPELEATQNIEHSQSTRGKDKPPCQQKQSLNPDRFQFSTNIDQYGCPEKWYVPEKRGPPIQQLFTYGFGNPEDMAVCNPLYDSGKQPKMFASKLSHVTSLLASDSFDPIALASYLENTFLGEHFPEQLVSLKAIGMACGLYSRLQDAKVPISAATKHLYKFKWALSSCLSLGVAFSCIAMFEIGGSEMDIEPRQLNKVMAISTGNSLYMAEYLFCDPHDELSGWGVRRAIGNIGRPGLSFLVSPIGPKISKVDDASWKVIKHDDYDGKTDNNFTNTTLHLSFTGSELPVSSGDLGLYDKEAYFLEAVIGAFDGGKWVADVDIWSSMVDPTVMRLNDCKEHAEETNDYRLIGPLTSIDSWDELLDLPDNACVARAHNNWLARLAIASVVSQKQRPCLIASEHICWKCVLDCMISRNAIVLH
jgi:hypothetical protein